MIKTIMISLGENPIIHLKYGFLRLCYKQTQVTTVIPYYNRWMKKFPTIQDVAKADIDIILKYWEGLGYYSRAHNIKKRDYNL